MATKKTPPRSARRTSKKKTASKRSSYLHGFTATETDRLQVQARTTEPWIHDRLPFRRARRMLEVGSGVGAQTEILLRHFPELELTCVEKSSKQIEIARRFLRGVAHAHDRYEIHREDAMQLSFGRECFDGAFLCWILEHVPDPAQVLAEVRRVLVPGSPIVVTEVMNHTFFLDPYSPNTWRYWMAFNDVQREMGGDPFVGAKLGNLLQQNGYRDIQTEVKVVHFDNREPGERADFIGFWSDLLLSGAEQLIAAKKVSKSMVERMQRELDRVAHDPNSIFFYAFLQARARA